MFFVFLKKGIYLQSLFKLSMSSSFWTRRILEVWFQSRLFVLLFRCFRMGLQRSLEKRLPDSIVARTLSLSPRHVLPHCRKKQHRHLHLGCSHRRHIPIFITPIRNLYHQAALLVRCLLLRFKNKLRCLCFENKMLVSVMSLFFTYFSY